MNISVLLRHSGFWMNDSNYEGYKSDGIVIGDNVTYEKLISAIAAELEIDETRKKIEARYIVEGNSSPLLIRNDMGIKLYIEVKKSVTEFGMYPLCISTIEKDEREMLFEGEAGAVVCLEDMEKYGLALAHVDSKISESSSLVDIKMNNVITDSNNSVVKEGQIYKDKKTLVSVMSKYAIDHCYNFKAKRSDNQSYVLKCYSEDCCWIFKASCRRSSELFQVRSFNDVHNCPLKDGMLTHVQATMSFVSGFTAPKLLNHKRIHTPTDIIEDIKSAFGVGINYQKAWRDKERAIDMIRGTPADGYCQLPRYLYMLNSVYPGSHIRMHKSKDNKFMYLFIALHPLMRGFQFCRPVVVVDGAHLGGAYKGTFLSASTFDGAGCILPIAYGVVDSENDSSWTWFFEQLKSAFGERENMCVVSDRHESIIKAVSIVYPNVPHLACIWHLWKNVCTNFRRSKDRLSEMYYAMAKACRQEDFDFFMNQVGKVDHRVKEYLENAGYEKWARVYAPVNRGRMMTSNIAECINGKLVEACELPILDFLEQTRILFVSWNCKNRDRASYTKTTLRKRFECILQLNKSKASRLMVKASSPYVYSVLDDGRRYIVCLERRTYSCGRFQPDEITCQHVIAVLKSKHVDDMKPYCSEYYHPETLVKTYEVSMFPMPDKKDWIVPQEIQDKVVLPPKYKRQPGIPKKGRLKKASESLTSSSNCCGRCGYEGHNKHTCNFFPKDE